MQKKRNMRGELKKKMNEREKMEKKEWTMWIPDRLYMFYFLALFCQRAKGVH